MKVAFANISLIIDFDSDEEAEKYKKDNFGKGWWFGETEYNPMIKKNGLWKFVDHMENTVVAGSEVIL